MRQVLVASLFSAICFASGCSSSQTTAIGGSINPRNVPDDVELNSQHDDFLSFMRESGIDCVSFGSLGVTLAIPSVDLERARALIDEASAKRPSRWDRLALEVDERE